MTAEAKRAQYTLEFKLVVQLVTAGQSTPAVIRAVERRINKSPAVG
ncbi:hypothetical protein [Burkholderia sp. GS2Y]|uniref:Transposase n=1 Tax=Burkholderia theae TaxID=3143496 RepID=A0ABU9WMX1_9BURK